MHSFFFPLVYLLLFLLGYHLQWNTCVSVRHPSLWTFICCLKDEQGITDYLERRLIRLEQDYMNGVRNLEGYWDTVRHWVVSY